MKKLLALFVMLFSMLTAIAIGVVEGGDKLKPVRVS